jgi:hypothetical protein
MRPKNRAIMASQTSDEMTMTMPTASGSFAGLLLPRRKRGVFSR